MKAWIGIKRGFSMKNIYLWIALVFFLLISACSSGAVSSTPTSQGKFIIADALVTRVEILKSPDLPGEIRVVVSGEQPDSCTRVDAEKITQQDHRFIITVPMSRPLGQSCPGGTIPFEKSISLNTASFSPGNYEVDVNGLTNSFQIDEVAGTAFPTPEKSLTPGPTQGSTGTSTPAAPAAETSQSTSVPAGASQSTPVPNTAAAPLGPTQTQEAGITGEGGCIDKAAYYGDVTIPDGTSFKQNETFTKTWKIRNAGTCSWGKGYSLIFAGGDQMNGPLSTPMPAVTAGDIVDVSVNLVTPPNGGEYVGNWEFQNPQGKRFGVNSGGGDLIWVKIGVSIYPMVTPSATNPTNVSAACSPQEDAGYESQLLSFINNARADQGLKPLTLNPLLSAAALGHSKDMACQNYVDHTGSDGSSWFDRIKAQGYQYSQALENIYVGNPKFGGDAQGAFNWWMNSKIHHDNIMSTKITEIGIAYVFWEKSNYGGYYTLNFAKPKQR
jgi:uncharacterized protein YkwD